MFNVGLNQFIAVFKSNYGEIQREGHARDTMISAMREVMTLSEKEWGYLLQGEQIGHPAVQECLKTMKSWQEEICNRRKFKIFLSTNQITYMGWESLSHVGFYRSKWLINIVINEYNGKIVILS